MIDNFPTPLSTAASAMRGDTIVSSLPSSQRPWHEIVELVSDRLNSHPRDVQLLVSLPAVGLVSKFGFYELLPSAPERDLDLVDDAGPSQAFLAAISSNSRLRSSGEQSVQSRM